MFQTVFRLLVESQVVNEVDLCVSEIVDRQKELIGQIIVRLYLQDVSPETTFQFEQELEAAGKELMRLLLEWALNQLEPTRTGSHSKDSGMGVRSVSAREQKDAEPERRHAFRQDHAVAISVSLPTARTRAHDLPARNETRVGRARDSTLRRYRGTRNGRRGSESATCYRKA
ncbi:hypothetical protein ACFL2H_02445 [Planctomycetota bacterium]